MPPFRPSSGLASLVELARNFAHCPLAETVEHARRLKCLGSLDTEVIGSRTTSFGHNLKKRPELVHPKVTIEFDNEIGLLSVQ